MDVFKEDTLKNRVAFITGGGTGIGFGIAKKFVQHGASVVIMGRRQAVLEKAVEELKREARPNKREKDAASFVVGDVRFPESSQKALDFAFEKYGHLDILVNNAAGNFMCAADQLTPKGFRTVLDIDLQGTFNVSKAAYPYLKKQSPGRDCGVSGIIINISATLQLKATPFQAHAAAAKAGIDVLSQTLGIEWGAEGVRVVSIAPGPIEGTVGGPGGRVFGGALSEEHVVSEGFKIDSDIVNTVPLGRWGRLDDVAGTALFLASDAGSFINATQIIVDGGQWHGTSQFYQSLKDLVSAKSEEERKSHKGGVKKAKL
eukprot:CAMPEP_0201488836 /NCGR_PEP_ID=MMETSP0151_2-20130828/19718_1 /ASSEMBLY_ACC=CAM_ASM_000257 /TAXON_ID=200890 /ORGANISM="Paramoeba atlantica, Strain 621/1 / CCAP 1560/9" /LENGTH=315 /DNA_ID=CAMNT_0047874211 /DNA_START=66 /DNA_END=1013 /DNA_ORIENTATION=+